LPCRPRPSVAARPPPLPRLPRKQQLPLLVPRPLYLSKIYSPCACKAQGLFLGALPRPGLPLPLHLPPVIALQPMKRLILVLGILLLAAGVIGIIHPRFTYNKTEEVAKIGPVQANVTHEKAVEVPLAISILLVVTGVGLAVFGIRAKA